MRLFLKKINTSVKGLVLWSRPGVLFGFLSAPLLFVSNLLELTRWISRQQKKKHFTDFPTFKRTYDKRYALYEHLFETDRLDSLPINYLEFGVSEGHSFRWWSSRNVHPGSRFAGFDTFEGLPEKWGVFYKKGDMSAPVPEMADVRTEFVKGLFQDTLNGYLEKNIPGDKINVIHLDADLFTSTIFVLTTFARHLKKGDILLFDEFNVPGHEWMAYRIFTQSFYIKTELIGGVNNYYQAAFRVL